MPSFFNTLLKAVGNSNVKDNHLNFYFNWETLYSTLNLALFANCFFFRHRFRQVSRPAIGAGRSCSRKLERKKRCDLPACPQPCIPQPWGSWGPCSRTCGTAGVQLRYRKVNIWKNASFITDLLDM